MKEGLKMLGKNRCKGSGEVIRKIDYETMTVPCPYCKRILKVRVAWGGYDDHARYCYLPTHNKKEA